MTDLFDNILEAQGERQSIQMADGITTSTAELHRCEVLTIVNRYFPNGDPKPFFLAVEKHRGLVAADKLRADCRAEWVKRKAHKST